MAASGIIEKRLVDSDYSEVDKFEVLALLKAKNVIVTTLLVDVFRYTLCRPFTSFVSFRSVSGFIPVLILAFIPYTTNAVCYSYSHAWWLQLSCRPSTLFYMV